MIIDTHAHLNFSAYKSDLNEVVERCVKEKIWVVNVGSQYDTSKRAMEIAEKYGKGFFASIGLHPLHLQAGLVKIKEDLQETQFVSREEKFDPDRYKDLAESKKVVAIGEAGFDYYWKPKTKKKLEIFKKSQEEALSGQFLLAKELALPFILHCRMAHQNLISFLEENEKIRPERAIVHSFVGTEEQLKKYLGFGYHIGLNGIIFKSISGIDFAKIISNIPLDKMMVETDCPYLAPPGLKERNEPVFVKYVIERISEIKGISIKEVEERTFENAREFFNI